MYSCNMCTYVAVVILGLTMIIMVESEYCPRLASCPGCLYAASLTLVPVNTHYVMYVTVEVSDVVSGKTEVLITKVNFSTVLLQSAHCVCMFVYAYVWRYTHVSSVGGVSIQQ